jgi:chromosome segregation ATPase
MENHVVTKNSHNTLQRSLEFFKKKINDLEEKNKELIHKNEEMKKETGEIKQNYEELKKDNNDTKQKNAALKQGNDEFKQQNEELKQENKDLKQKNEDLKQENYKIKLENDEIKRENEELKLENVNFTNLAMDYENNMLDNFNKDDCIEFIEHKLVLIGECVIIEQDKEQNERQVKFNIISINKSHDVITLNTNYKNYNFKMEVETIDDKIMLTSNFKFKINTDTPRSMGSNKMIADITDLINLATFKKLYGLLNN